MTALAELLLGLDYSLCNGCSACHLRCTAGVPMSRTEFERVREYETRLAPDDGINAPASRRAPIRVSDGVAVDACRFLDPATMACAVYPVRPLVCRMMGLVEWMPCPIGAAVRAAPTPVALSAVEEYCREERCDYETWVERVRSPIANGGKGCGSRA